MLEKKETAGETAMQVYTYNEKDVKLRIQTIDGNPWFAVKDLCEILEHSNHKVAILGLDDDEVRKVYLTDSLGRKQETLVTSESGMYTLIIRSNKPEAKKFRKWVTGEVLPSIRKTGRYEASTEPQSTRKLVCRRSRSELVNAELLNLLWLIGESLRQGEIRDVALELGVSRQTVSKVLNGYARNARVLMALYNRAKANRACGMIYHRPDLMAERLIDADNGDVLVQMPSVVYGSRKKGGQIGNQNARKHWGKEGK